MWCLDMSIHCEMIAISKYLLTSNLPLLYVRITLPIIIIAAPNILFRMMGSFRKMNPKIIMKTVDNLLIILNVDVSSPYLASVFNLSVMA